MRATPWPRVLALAGIATSGGLAAAAACTTFSGTQVPDASDADSETAADAGSPGYLSTSDAAKLCARVFQCPTLADAMFGSTAVPVDRTNYSLCMHWLAGPIPPDRVGFEIQRQAFACMLAAPDCAQAALCMWYEPFAANDPRCADAAADAADKCIDDGKTVLRCTSSYALHCSSTQYRSGSKCLQGSYNDAADFGCALGQNCNVAYQCGSYYDYCGVDTLTYSISCAFSGMACNTTSDASAVCITGTQYKPCNTAGTTCAGDVVEACSGGWLEQSEFDCAALGSGGTCSIKDGPARCVGPSDECSPFDHDQNTCGTDGTSISLCIGGRKTTFDCAAAGMKCVAGSGGASSHCG